MRRFYDLTPSDQLRAYRALREFLGAAAPTETSDDRKLVDRVAALEALETAARHLRLADGQAPTGAEFDAAAKELGLEWTSARVGRAWGSWRFALDAFRGDRPRLTAAQHAMRRKQVGARRTHEAHVPALRAWLATAPQSETRSDYDAWASEANKRLREDQPPYPTGETIRANLGRSWPNIVRVAKGEITLDDLAEEEAKREPDWIRGPHKLVSQRGIAEILNVKSRQANVITGRLDFPVPAATIAGQRLWLEEDVVAYGQGRPIADREENELQELYMGAQEVADLLSTDRHNLSRDWYERPEPAGRVGRRVIWLRAEVETWASENADLLAQRRKRAEQWNLRPRRSGATARRR